MALNVTESNALSTVLRYLFGRRRLDHAAMPTDEEMVEALAVLADSANKRMQAGMTGDDIREAWPTRRITLVAPAGGGSRGVR